MVALYSLFFYTPDIRARLPFLLDWMDLPLLLFALAVFTVFGILGTLLLRVSPLAARRGIATGVVACIMVLASGLFGWLIPAAEYEGSPLYGIMIGAVFIAGLVLRRARTSTGGVNEP